jgi:glutamyl-tRNA reductase
MELLMLGLNHKTAPVDVRERFAITKQAIKSGLANLNEYEGLSEAVVLSTCNRSEMYVVVDDAERDLPTLKQFLFDLTGK